MAVNMLNYYSNVDTSITDLQSTENKNFIGKHNLTLTNYDNTTAPEIAAGSVIEVNGALYEFTANTVISGSPSDGTVYIYFVPSGDPDPDIRTATLTPTYTNTAPTWSDSKQGWYGTGGSANYRYAEYILTKATTAYGKGLIDPLKKSYVNVTFTTMQTLGSTDPVKVVFDTKIYDSKSEFDEVTNYRFTAKNNGYYLITGGLTIVTAGADILLYKNGSIITAGKSLIPTGFTGFMSFSYVAFLNSGDYLEIYADGSATTQLTQAAARLNIIQVA